MINILDSKNDSIEILIEAAKFARKNAMSTARILTGKYRSLAVSMARSNNRSVVRHKKQLRGL